MTFRSIFLCTLCGWLCILATDAAADVPSAPGRLVLKTPRVVLTLGEQERGAIVSLQDAVSGREYIARQAKPRLFNLVFAPNTNPPGERFSVDSNAADRFEMNAVQTGGTTMATLRYAGFGGRPIRVLCTATVAANNPLVHWRLSADFPSDLVLEEIQFPFVVWRAPLDGNASTDAAVLGMTKGGVFHHPAAWKIGQRVYARQPGSLAAQFACYYDAAGGVYLATYDGTGWPKDVEMRRTAEGLEMDFNPHTFAVGSCAPNFDTVLTTFTGSGGADADWRDAADIYKQWALTQPWCRRTYAQRDDIPAWMKAGPAMVRFNRAWLAQPAQIEKWLSQYWKKYFAPDTPLITAYWGWEKIESWVTPDYFPVFPSDEAFEQLVKDAHRLGCHAFPWPSGYHWTLTYGKQADGTFLWDDRSSFDRIARPHAVVERNGATYVRQPSWLRGGETACLCPGDPWTRRWWDEDVCLPLARRGAELIQVDQVVGGSFPFCYSREHGHPPGPGTWMTDVFRDQLRTMLQTCRQVQPDAVVCFEEPNEQFIQQVGIQDYRDFETVWNPRAPEHEPASVFNYLYHEYLPTFQSNPRAADLVMDAYCLVNGEIPHMVPSMQIGPGPLLINGNFEEWSGDVPLGWDHLKGYQGKVWNGKPYRDAATKHGGATSLRLENIAATDTVQVAQNVPVNSAGLIIGKRYRLSAWMKVEQMAQPNNIIAGTFTAAVQSTGGGGQIAFPKPDSGWVRGSMDFTVPAGSALLRIMLHVHGPAKLWIDDMTLAEIKPDGTTAPVMRSPVPADHHLMQQWVNLFHGAGRQYLLYGRMLHPPKLVTDRIEHLKHSFPAVFHNAFQAPDGSEAVVLANATDDSQKVTLTWHGRQQTLQLQPEEVRLVR